MGGCVVLDMELILISELANKECKLEEEKEEEEELEEEEEQQQHNNSIFYFRINVKRHGQLVEVCAIEVIYYYYYYYY